MCACEVCLALEIRDIDWRLYRQKLISGGVVWFNWSVGCPFLNPPFLAVRSVCVFVKQQVSTIVSVGSASGFVCMARSASRLGHYDLVDTKDGDHHIEGQFKCPRLGVHAVEDASLDNVLDRTILHVNAILGLVAVNFGVHVSQDAFGFDARIFSQSARNHLK